MPYTEFVCIDGKTYACYEESIPVLTPPEGIDLWNEYDLESKTTLKKSESIIRDAGKPSCAGFVLPFGWKLKFNTVLRRVEVSEVSDWK